MVGTTADFWRFGPRRSLPFNDLPDENSGTAGRIGEVGLRALDWARRQGALSWELRTATSLSRLWRDQSRAQEAHGLLAPIYDRFTEGFATADLRAAKALIDEITPTIPPFSTDASPAVLPLRP